jgi:histidinol phosphatase-like PHP family hydrolase
MLSVKEDYHVHCNYNDHSSADLTIPNAVRRAEKIGLKTIAFTEHVRRSSEWVSRYLTEVESAIDDASNAIKIIPGFEAKILADGSIDCPEYCAQKYFLVASFHTHYADKRIWINALEKAIENKNVDVIGHLVPEDSFTLEEDEVEHLARLMAANNKIVEINAKYHAPPPDWLKVFKRNRVRFHLGSDAHSLEAIGRFEKVSDLIAVVT